MACAGGFRRVVEFAEMEEGNEIEARKHSGAERVNIPKKDLVILGDLGLANNQFNIGSMLAFRGGDCQDFVALWAHDVGAPEKVMFAAAKMENGFRADSALGKVLGESESHRDNVSDPTPMSPVNNLAAWEGEDGRAKAYSHRLVMDRGVKYETRLGSHAVFLPRRASFQQ